MDKIPHELRERPQWVLWRTETKGDRPTKLPFTVSGAMAKSNDPNTWTTYAKAVAAADGYDGIGFMFSADDPFCGIDLDACRDPQSGSVAEWAKEIIRNLDTYAEVSPSQTGVKLFCKATLNADTGRKLELDYPPVADKHPAIEIYAKLRYFAVTGQRLAGISPRVEERSQQVAELCQRFWPQAPTAGTADFYAPESVIERARKYIAQMPPAVSGQGGHKAAFKVACVLTIGFGLARDTALALLREWNQTCQPPWSERELIHKIESALKQPGERNYLRNAHPSRWATVGIPDYDPPIDRVRPHTSTLSAAIEEYVQSVLRGEGDLIETGVSELDYAIGGGLAFGELMVVAGRPSHGKSLLGLQCAHTWTDAMIPSLIITEEMSRLQLGRRTLLFASDIPEEHWKHDATGVAGDIADYTRMRAECYVVESCQRMETAREEIERHIVEHDIKAVVIDYAQLLQSKGHQRWEQMANTSEELRRIASKHGIIVCALVQMNQEIEKRPKFQPKLSDLGDTGAWSRDADVVVFTVWPHRLDYHLPANEYKIYVAKNRNRPINQSVVMCRIEPSRQRIVEQRIQDMPNYEPAFEGYEVP